MLSTNASRILPPLPPWVRLAIAGVVAAVFAFAVLELNRVEQVDQVSQEMLEPIVPVPELDEPLLAQVSEATPAERVQVEAEPLRHLLQKAIDVGPTVAAALNIPADPVPVDAIRKDPHEWRHRWLWYEGKIVSLSGPRSGHPIQGYSIYEVILELADGEHIVADYSIPPERPLVVGDWARAEGYLLKLRDVTYPLRFESAPMLIGRTLQRDYPDWGPITSLDPHWFDDIDDQTMWPGDQSFRGVDEDQCEALWHLGAFVRDTKDARTLADWRKIGTLTADEPYERLRKGEVARGEPMRVFGTLIRRQTIAAPANPANIKFWTAVWIQVTEFGGHLVPIWIPDRIPDLPPRAQLEVRGFYYRWYVYDAQKDGTRYRVPLFVAASLDQFELNVDQTMRQVGGWIGGIAAALLVLLFWGQRRMARSSMEHSRRMDERRRRRRQAKPAATAE